jgi:hypothetical protein
LSATGPTDPTQPQGGFPHYWQASILRARPLILPRRSFVYPRHAEEVERGALELLVQPVPLTPPLQRSQPSPLAAADRASASAARSAPSVSTSEDTDPFLATCALGFADPLAPTGLWTCPNPDQLCAVAGGYAYLIHTLNPADFEQVPYRPAFAIHAALEANLLLFIGNRSILAYGPAGRAWESPRLSDEGLTIDAITQSTLHGKGWQLATDQEVSFILNLADGTLG